MDQWIGMDVDIGSQLDTTNEGLNWNFETNYNPFFPDQFVVPTGSSFLYSGMESTGGLRKGGGSDSEGGGGKDFGGAEIRGMTIVQDQGMGICPVPGFGYSVGNGE